MDCGRAAQGDNCRWLIGAIQVGWIEGNRTPHHEYGGVGMLG